MFTAVRVVVTVLLADVKALYPFLRRPKILGVGRRFPTRHRALRDEWSGARALFKSARRRSGLHLTHAFAPPRRAWVSQGRFMTRAPVASGAIPHRRHPRELLS
jgi:hypothetical protein